MKAGSLKNCQAIITGVNGFIGKTLARRLIEQGAFVLGVDQLPLHDRLGPSSQFQFIQANLLTEAGKIHLKQGDFEKKIFFHLAGMANAEDCEKNKELAGRMNIDLTRLAVEFCLNHGIRQFIFPSTGLVYGDHHSIAVTEQTAPAPLNYYAQTKLEAEQLIRDYAEKTGFCCVVLRLSNVYGAGMSPKSVIGELIGQAKKEQNISLRDYSPVRDFIFLDDVVDGMLAATNIHKNGFYCFNLSTGKGTSIQELAQMASRLTSASFNNAQWTKKGHSQKSCLVMDNRSLEEVTGWKPKSTLDDGLKKILQEIPIQ